ncbi:MAG TPA: hypothetical protein VM936_15260 [Pyrinomonadaceae bacterium]|nr:hypothetical protein [Pyrinomonadaceae bacterium]
MKRTGLPFAALCGVALLLTAGAKAQTKQPNRTALRDAPAETSKVSGADKTVGAAKTADAAEAAGDTPDVPAAEVEGLKRRVEELENQNRTLAQALAEINAKLSALTPAPAGAATANAAQAQAASSQPSAASAQAPSAPKQDDKNAPVRWSDLVGEGNRFKLYGFLRLDLDFDSQHPSNTQIPFFVTSPDSRAGGTENGDYSIHPRLTRLGIDFTGPTIHKLRDAKLTGKFESDFENGGTESRQIIRIRHAYLRLGWKDFSVLGGQTWDVVSPLFPVVNNDSLMWNAGNVGDRRPQLRASYEPKSGKNKYFVSGAIGLTGAIDSQDLDANGFRDGEESGLPNFQGRLGYARAIGAGRDASVGVSGFYGFMKTARAVAGRTDFNAQLLNVDFTLPIHPRFTLRGEGWWGRGMSDVRGGAGQGINTATGREIRGRGGWGEATLRVSRYLTISPGFTTDDPVDRDLGNGARTRNRAFYLGDRISPSANFLIGADYLRWRTDYKGFLSGVDNRVNIFLQYSF